MTRKTCQSICDILTSLSNKQGAIMKRVKCNKCFEENHRL